MIQLSDSAVVIQYVFIQRFLNFGNEELIITVFVEMFMIAHSLSFI